MASLYWIGFLVLRPEYTKRTRWILGLQMPWLLHWDRLEIVDWWCHCAHYDVTVIGCPDYKCKQFVDLHIVSDPTDMTGHLLQAYATSHGSTWLKIQMIHVILTSDLLTWKWLVTHHSLMGFICVTYEANPSNSRRAMERTQHAGQMDGWMEWIQYTLNNLFVCGV